MDWMSNHEEMEGGFSDDSCSCPDCESTNTQMLDSGSDDDGDWYEVWECGECETKFDHDGDYVFDGMSDYQERMHERRQMGLCNF